jgi:hypothetical protein
MIALVPTNADLDRLALPGLPGGEPRDELHLTLWFLGEASAITAETRSELVTAVTHLVERRDLRPVAARAFGIAHWNPYGDDPAWVLNVGDVRVEEHENPDADTLGVVRAQVHEAWHDGGVTLDLPTQHTPWQPHICVAYTTENVGERLLGLLGDVTLDRVRVAFGDDVTDVPLAQPATVAAASGGDRVPWHKTHDHADCPSGKPWAVVKDGTGEVKGCHATEDDANDQLAALYRSERESDAATPVVATTETNCVDCDDEAHFTGAVTLAADGPWNGAASRFTDEQYRRSAAACDTGNEPPKTRCFLPHHEPGGALNRSGVHAAAARLNQVTGRSSEAVARARSHLRSHYRQLGEEIPDVLKTSASTTTLGNGGGGFADRATDDCPEGQHRMPDGSCMSDDEMYAASTWEGVLVVEGTPTGDGREFALDALTWVDQPLLRWQKEGAHGGEHDVTVTVGRIDEVWRDGDVVRGRGVLDLLSVDGFELRRRLHGGFAGGISIDADDIQDADVEFVWPDSEDAEVADESGAIVQLLFGRPEKMIFHAGRIRAATVVDIPAFVEARIALTDGQPIAVTAGATATRDHVVPRHETGTSDAAWDAQSARDAAPANAFTWVDEDRRELLHHEHADGDLGPANVTACATAIGLLNGGRGGVDLPSADRLAAYEHLAAHLRDAGQEPPPIGFDHLLTVNASVEVDDWRPPRVWFEDPGLSVPIGITVTDQGRVYGHVAQWGECHIGYDELCVTPPREDVHPYFMTGEVVCADGSRVAVGQITVGTGHAPLTYRASRAAEHYDNTGCAVADVVVGNDQIGIWAAGAVRPYVEAARVHDLRASGQVSGDWRRIGSSLRLVGLLAVNVPGFPVPSLRARVASGVPQALVAAGRTVVAPRVVAPGEDELNRLALRRVMSMLARRMGRTSEVEGAR